MLRLVCTLAAVLLTASIASAEYTQVGSTQYYVNAAGDYFTRTPYNVYFGYYYDYYGKYRPRYYYEEYTYTPVSKPASSLTPKSSDAEWLDFLKQREKIQGAIAKSEQDKNAFLERLAKVGVSPPFAGGPAFSYNGSGYAALTGSTLYGYSAPHVSAYSYSQVADIYGTLDPNILMQGSVAMARASNESATSATALMNGALNNISAAAERLQAQRIEGELAIQKLKAVTPNRITTTINGKTVEPPTMPKVGTLPPLPPADGGVQGPFSPKYVAVVTNSCVSCHAPAQGKELAGKFDMTAKVLTDEQKIKVLRRVTLSVTDKQHMPPPAKEGMPAVQLTPKQIADLLD